jgi:hypothetical protein
MAIKNGPLTSEPAEALAKFVHDENIAHYQKCLTMTTDEAQRKILRELLANKLSK